MVTTIDCMELEGFQVATYSNYVFVYAKNKNFFYISGIYRFVSDDDALNFDERASKPIELVVSISERFHDLGVLIEYCIEVIKKNSGTFQNIASDILN